MDICKTSLRNPRDMQNLVRFAAIRVPPVYDCDVRSNPALEDIMRYLGALLLLLVMIVGIQPVSALAQEAGTQSAADEYATDTDDEPDCD